MLFLLRWQSSNFLWTPKEGTPTWSAVNNFKWLICAQLSICWTLMYTAITSRLEYPWGLLFSHSVMSNTLWPHGLQHARLPCPPPSPRACSNSCLLNQWRQPTISSSVVPFSYCPVFPSISMFSNELALHIRWPKYWSFMGWHTPFLRQETAVSPIAWQSNKAILFYFTPNCLWDLIWHQHTRAKFLASSLWRN